MGSRGLTGGHLEKAVLPPTNLQFFLNLWRREVCDKTPSLDVQRSLREPRDFPSKTQFVVSLLQIFSEVCVQACSKHKLKKKKKKLLLFLFQFLSFGIAVLD
jgi:hypothetical protein